MYLFFSFSLTDNQVRDLFRGQLHAADQDQIYTSEGSESSADDQ